MPKVTEAYCTKNRRYLANVPLSPVGIVLHSVGTPQPDAQVFYRIWSEDRSQYFTHYVLDAEKILHTMPNDRRCWHVGHPGNSKWLGIEMCEPDTIRYTGGASFDILDREKAGAFCEACYRNATELIAALCTEYGWDPDTALLTHGEITKNKLSDTTHADPEHLWNGLGLPYSLNTLKRDVKAAMQESSGSIPTKQTKPDPAKAFDKRLAGSYTVTASALNVRSGAGTDKAILTVLPNGTTVRNYGYYTEKNGTWLYVAFTQNGTPMEGYCFAQYLMRR